MANITGTNGNDKGPTALLGTAADDVIKGLNGNDEIFADGSNGSAAGGNDTIDGGNGNDIIRTGTGNDTVDGGNGNDTITDAGGDNNISGGTGADTITTGSGNDTIDGGSDNDTIDAGGGNNIVYGGSGNDSITAGDGNDWINGGSGDDIINAGNGTNEVFGDSGNDKITTGSGVDTIDAGSGNDEVHAGGGNDTVDGGTGNDTIEGGLGDDTLKGGSGNDTFIGFVGGPLETVDGGTGIDTIEVGPGANADLAAATDGQITNVEIISAAHAGAPTTMDVHLQSENFTFITSGFGDTIHAGSGDDTFIAPVNNVRDTFDGDGNPLVNPYGDTADYSAYSTILKVNLGDPAPIIVHGSGADDLHSDVLINVENFIGGSANDEITGDAKDNVIEGNKGNDKLDGAGNTAVGDTVSYEHATGGVTVNLLAGTATGAAGNDALSNFENIRGSAFVDTLTGNGGDNVIEGGKGNDILNGGTNGANGDTVSYKHADGSVLVNLLTGTANGADGNDTLSNFENILGSDSADILIGSIGVNKINGGGGSDAITGSLAGDTLTGGGPETDVFAYLTAADSLLLVPTATLDHITDFTLADLLLFAPGLVANGDTGVVNQNVAAFANPASFAAGVGFLIEHTGTQAQVYVDTGTDGVFNTATDLVIRLDTDPGDLTYGLGGQLLSL